MMIPFISLQNPLSACLPPRPDMSGSYNQWSPPNTLYAQQQGFNFYPHNPQQQTESSQDAFQFPHHPIPQQSRQDPSFGTNNLNQTGSFRVRDTHSLSVNTTPRVDPAYVNAQYLVPSDQVPHHLSGPSPQSKRARVHERDPDDAPAGDSPDKEGLKKPAGACARCKSLKVKCEFLADPDTCKRCLNGGHECVIPGRKKRRVPPKREHLINQIRAQAEQINKLIAQLEAVQRSQGQPPNLESAIIRSPSVSTEGDSFDESGVSPSSAPAYAEGNKAIEDWLAKAKESFLQFGDSISKSYVSDDDSDSAGWGDDDYENVGQDDLVGYRDENEKYEIAVMHPDDTTEPIVDFQGGRLQKHGSNSSLSTTTVSVSGSTGHPRKKGGEKPSNLPTVAAPWGLISRLSIQHRANSADPEDTGINNSDYFISSNDENDATKAVHSAQPHILARGIISTSEAEKLFVIYFDKMNDSTSLLDPIRYTPPLTAVRSSFLFTVICAIASRYYAERPDLYPQLMHYAQLAAGTGLISGTKNVEMCAAYILLSLYPVSTRRMAEQRSWLYLGLAIRTATDINLHLPIKEKPRNEWQAREILNRTRIWLNCFNVDRSMGSQYGKPPIINNRDYLANHSPEWYKSSPYNLQHFDIHICAYNAELRLMADFSAKIHNDPEQPTGLNKNLDLVSISMNTDEELKALWAQWQTVLEGTDLSVPQNRFRTGLLRLAYSYSRLIALSFGFQHVFSKGAADESIILFRCLDAARDIVRAVLDDICRPEQLFYWRHGPESQSIFLTFASTFLIKLLQPRFASHINQETRAEIKGLVKRVVELLSSKEITIDERLGPGLHARFLRNLLHSPTIRQDLSYARRKRVTKSAGTASELFDYAPLSNQPSPVRSGGSLSPTPSQEMNFDMFSAVGVGATEAPYFQGLDNTGLGLSYMTPVEASIPTGKVNSTPGTLSDMFSPPLGGDGYMMQTMQAFGSNENANAYDWEANHGYVWFPQFQQNMGMDTLLDPSRFSQHSQ